MTDIVVRLREAADEIERLRELFRIDGEQHAARIKEIQHEQDARLAAYKNEIERLYDRKDDLVDALHQIVSWSEAYPLDILPEPDFTKAHEVLMANGMTIDAISASAARHALESVGAIARAALKEKA